MPSDADYSLPPVPVHRQKFNAAYLVPVAQFWLKNAEGDYLHFSGNACAVEKVYRWNGTSDQAKKLRAAHPYAQTFTKLVHSK